MSTTAQERLDRRRVIALAKTLVPKIKTAQARARQEWEEEARACHKEGYRPSHCLHGTSLWTDYDPMCMGCEEYGFNGLPNPYEEALSVARSAWRTFDERREAIAAAVALLMRDGNAELVSALYDWATEPMLRAAS